MSDGITLYCPSCGKLTALKKEYDELKVKLKQHSINHPEDDIWYDSSLPVYTCADCKQKWTMEKVM